MAKKRVQVEELRQITANQPQIGMVDTYVRPATPQRDKSLDDLASFLDKASAQVAYVGKQKKDAEVATAIIAAQEYAYTSGEMQTFAEARDSGNLDIIKDPTVEIAYNKSIGIRMGRQLSSQMQNRIEELGDEVYNKSPEDFDKWYTDTSKEIMGTLDNKWLSEAGVRLGVVSHLDGAYNNAKQSHLAKSRERREEKLYDAFLVGMNDATESAWSTNDFAFKVNQKQRELLDSESAYTGTRLNKYMATWLAEKIKTTDDPEELGRIRDSLDQIKAGSGTLGGTGVWQQVSEGLFRQASDRVQSLADKAHTLEGRERNDYVTVVEDEMVAYYQENDNLDGYEAPESDLVNKTDIFQMKKQIENLLKPDETKDFTLDEAVAMYEHFVGMTETEMLTELHNIRTDNSVFKVTTMRQFSALEGIARDAIQRGSNPFSADAYRSMQKRIDLGFDPLFNGIGEVVINETNRPLYEETIVQLRTAWMSVIGDRQALAEYLPPQYESLRGQPWRKISQNPRAVKAVVDAILQEVEPSEYPAGSTGQVQEGVRREIPTENGVVIETEIN